MNVGRENFDTRRYVYFQDDNAAWQAFTKGGFEDIQAGEQLAALGDRTTISRRSRRATSSSAEFQTTSGEPMQGFVLNMRRPQFQDRRVREALT